MLNRYVFNCVLNAVTDEIFQSERGREFHNVGAFTLNDLPPTVHNQKRGMDNKTSSVDLN